MESNWLISKRNETKPNAKTMPCGKTQLECGHSIFKPKALSSSGVGFFKHLPPGHVRCFESPQFKNVHDTADGGNPV